MRNVLTIDAWEKIRANKSLVEQIPEWAKPVFRLTFDKVAALEPVMQSQVSTPPASEYVISEYMEMTVSYLEFLNGQIELKVRGDDWCNLLQKRVSALRSYVGKILLDFVVVKPVKRLSMKFIPPRYDLVYLEESSYLISL